MDKLLVALKTLNHGDDNDWTADGLPRVDRVNEISGQIYNRQQITDCAPRFFRGSEEFDVPKQPAIESAPIAQVEQHAPEDQPEQIVEEGNNDNAGESLNVLSKTWPEIFQSKETATSASNELSKIIAGKQAQINILNAELNKLHQTNNIIARAMSRFKSVDNNPGNINQYLKQSKMARAERAERANEFIKAKTTPGDVAKQMQVASPLDDAMKKRGSQRPVVAPR